MKTFILLISCFIVAKSLEDTTDLSSLGRHLRVKRSFGVDKNVKRDFEFKTKSGTTFKLSKSVTYNDGGTLTLLPALLDSIATNENRIISQLQHHKHGYHSEISPNHNTGVNDQIDPNAGDGEFDLNNLSGQARNGPKIQIDVDSSNDQIGAFNGHHGLPTRHPKKLHYLHGLLRRHRDVHHKVHTAEHKLVHHHIKHNIKHQIKHLGHKVHHHIAHKRFAYANPENDKALDFAKQLLAIKERALARRMSRMLIALSNVKKIDSPCCPDGPCCPGNQG